MTQFLKPCIVILLNGHKFKLVYLSKFQKLAAAKAELESFSPAVNGKERFTVKIFDKCFFSSSAEGTGIYMDKPICFEVGSSYTEAFKNFTKKHIEIEFMFNEVN